VRPPISLPLYARVLGWFFLNLLLLAAGVFFVARFQFRFRLDSLLMGNAGERLDSVGAVVAGELRFHPRTEWDAILTRLGQGYGLKLLGYTPEGLQVAGEATVLPDEVRARFGELRGRGGPPGDRGPGTYPGAGERRERGDRIDRNGLLPTRPGEGPRSGDWGRPPEPSGEGGSGIGSNPRGGGARPRFLVRSVSGGGYWIGLRALPPEPGPGHLGPTLLLAVSPSLSAGGLLLDPWPWIGAGLGAVLLSAIFWFPFVRGITRALSGMTAATERIAEGDFTPRAAVRRGDELGRLGYAIDRMAARLAGLVTGQKRFLGDVAHELCSPLARMEMALGVLDQKCEGRQREYVADVREEVRHMSGLVDELLSFSKASLRPKEVPLSPVPVVELVTRVIAREAPEGRTIEEAVAPGLVVLAEPELLARAVGNLLRNALRYAGEAGPISVQAILVGKEVHIAVADHGPGVPEGELSRLGEPFYRPELARTREGGGTGLGLAIVRQCVTACGGTLVLRNRKPVGFEAELRLTAAE